MNSRRNIYDKRDSLEMGDRAQDVFKTLAKKKDWQVTDASADSDINEHWDFWLEKGEIRYKIDVKAIKRISRYDSEVQDEWVWIELHGVRPYDLGWLYEGKADLIAFEKENSFIIVKRTDLIDLVHKIVDFKTIVKMASEAKYKLYQRRGRPDLITLIETVKLNEIKWDEWSKEYS